jgi:ATP-dependent DNA helicase DinG
MPRLSDLLSDSTDRTKLNDFLDTQKKKQKKSRNNPLPEKREPPRVVITPPDFVAIDFETTGLDPKTDRIIEFGLAKFINGECREQTSRYINPGISIPAAITNLTGITDMAVADAPAFPAVAGELLTFIADYPLCGHQVEFDFNFLNQELGRCGRPSVINPQIDTAALARIMITGVSGYSLTHVARELGITLESAHRALDDALASGHIAVNLIPRLAEIPPQARRIMAHFAPHSVLKKLLLRSVDNYDTGRKNGGRPQRHQALRLGIAEEPRPIDSAVIEQCFAQGGALGAQMPGYLPRQAQIGMAHSVTAALNDRWNLVAEAGTGVGKSLAYLIPAAFWALLNKTRVLISTHTRNLQDQLMSKDLPLVQAVAGKELRYSVLKGRSNYLCRDRWERLLSGEIGNLSRHERFGLLPLIRWAEETVTGDIEEQNQFNRRWFPKVWNLVSADSRECKGHRCSLYEQCFLQNARQQALCAHIVVINHALFFSDVCAETTFLGAVNAIVFDEAHHLEACGHRYLRVEVDSHRINSFVEYMNNLVKVLEPFANTEPVNQGLKRYKSILKNLRRTGQEFLGDLLAWVTRTHADAPRLFQIGYRDEPFASVKGFAELTMMLNEMQDALLNLQRVFAALSDKENENAGDITACLERTSQLKADLAYVSRGATEDHVFWIEGDRDKGWVKLTGVPLDVGGLLKSIWGREDRAAIFTSATLSISGSMEFFMRHAGLREEAAKRTRTEIAKSPFAANQMLRCAMRGSPEPSAEGYDVYAAGVILGLLGRFQKNILALFTANDMLARVHDHLKSSPQFPATALLLTQSSSPNRHLLLEQFKQSRHTVLLGTDSFWEGIDAPGQACEIVLIARLPFSVPTHPLAVAIAERCQKENGESFYSYAMPQAVIKFKQGAGRLIRSPHDRGALVVLDPRLVTKGYGKVFMRSVDGEFTESTSIEELTGRMQTFFDGCAEPAGPRYVPIDEVS